MEQAAAFTQPASEIQDQITLVECPRDAMQGWPHPISTASKVEYLNALLRVGFDVLDFGSFVSAKAIPQLADTREVIPQLKMDGKTKLLAIIANIRGAEDALMFDEISFLGFPFSISETFQQRNTNKSIAASLLQVEEIQNRCVQQGKELVVYISMGFGNPYGDPYNADVAIAWVDKLARLGIRTIAMSDTVGLAQKDTIGYIFKELIPAFPDVQIGAHFHAAPDNWRMKLDTSFAAGCRRYDAAINGIGGCPMAEDELVGNLATESLLLWCREHKVATNIHPEAFQEAVAIAGKIFV
ncbi:MAG: hydroxymethylglutaryl-CoA lyase [Bacteroidetes bacterium]|nr:hydroxymethylglutaryl-CoA lyase [Bacteroidota bacterium]MBS1628929.1 hydroxymethylglutaryl-CoA lyase [Bacteroidota bacterium]